MGRILGGVEIDRHPADPSAEPAVMPVEHAGRQRAPHREELVTPHVVFKARDRGLRGEGLAEDRISPEQQFMNGIVGEAVGIVAIGMAARDAEDPLAQQIRQRMPNLAGLPVVDQTLGEPLDHAILTLRGFEQDRTAIGAPVLLIEGGDEGLVEEIWEEDSLWYRVGRHASASVVAKSLSAQPLYHTEAFVLWLRSAASRIIRV